MAKKLLVVNCAALDYRMFREHADRMASLSALAGSGKVCRLIPEFPAITCPMQATFVTGLPPSGHGIVANGIYEPNLLKVSFWEQSSRLVQGRKIWEELKEKNPRAKTAMMFWQNSLASDNDIIVTPKPIHSPDGRTISECYSKPDGLYPDLAGKLGNFDLARYWGPGAGIASTEWIAAAAREVIINERPDLQLVYLPHLDYVTQKYGPKSPETLIGLEELDRVAGSLIECASENGYQVAVVSEYSVSSVSGAIGINTALRASGYISVYTMGGHEYLDLGECRAFAMSDHQVAHIYVREGADIGGVRAVVSGLEGVSMVLDRTTQAMVDVNHATSGDLIAIAEADKWFTYYWWLEDDKAPPFAHTVDIHRKPGYDPCELFIDTETKSIPIDPSLVKGSHGAPCEPGEQEALVILPEAVEARGKLRGRDVKDLLLGLLY